MENSIYIYLSSTGFTITAFLFLLLLEIIYYRKKTNETTVSPLFNYLMEITFLPLIFELVGSALYAFLPEGFTYKEILVNIINNLYLISSSYWIIIFIYYSIILIKKHVYNKKVEDTKKSRMIKYLIYTLGSILSTLIVLSVNHTNELVNITGPYVIIGTVQALINIMFFTVILTLIIMFIIHRKKIKHIFISPYVIIFLSYCLLTAVGQFIDFRTNNLSAFYGFIITIIFFTTENQDILLISNYNQAKEKEEKTNASKQKMLINISHEVREPMQNILGYTEQLLNKTDQEYQSDIDEIKKSIYELKDTIDSIYDISNIETLTNQVSSKTYDVISMFEKVNNYAIRKINKSNTRFTISIDEEVPKYLFGDEEKVYKILTKIIENAIYSTNYGEVKFEVNSKILGIDYREITYTISNSGHVMSEELFNMDYEEFMTSDLNNVDSIKLGVIIAKKYIEILGGYIEFINESGKGTKYIITLRQKISKENIQEEV